MARPPGTRTAWALPLLLAYASAAATLGATGAPLAPGPRLAALASALVLVLLVHAAGDAPRFGGRGALVAATFVALGAPLQLVATDLARATAAGLVALALLLLERRDPGVAVPAGVAVPVVACSAWMAGLSALALRAGPGPLPPGGWEAAPARIGHALDAVAMPLLLATFALFHRDGRGRAAARMALAAAALVVPLVSPREEDLRTAALLAAVVLAPAAGLGVDRMARMFSSDNPSPRARPLFTAAVLVVLWVFGVHEVRTLRRHGWGGPPPQAASAVRTARGEAP